MTEPRPVNPAACFGGCRAGRHLPGCEPPSPEAATVHCPYCEGTGRDLGRDRPCSDPNGCKGTGRLPPLPSTTGVKP